jgi:hypothetical protein
MSYGEPGLGEHVTLYADAGHVYGTINGRAFGTSPYNWRGGAGRVREYRHNPYRAFAAPRHPLGL